MKGKSDQEKLQFIIDTKDHFNQMVQTAGISRPDEEFKPGSGDPEIDPINPYGKIVCFTLMVYSMELGDPPLYSVINQVMRDMNQKYLKQLGLTALK